MSAWKDSLKRSALEALASIGDASKSEARSLLTELENAGHSVTLTADGSLEVEPRVTPEQGTRIRQLKTELVSVLSSIPHSVGWVPSDLSIQVSLCHSQVVDFVLAPKLAGVSGSPIPVKLANELLGGASVEWRARVKAIGPLCVYSLSQWEAAKPLLAAAMAAKKAS